MKKGCHGTISMPVGKLNQSKPQCIEQFFKESAFCLVAFPAKKGAFEKRSPDSV